MLTKVNRVLTKDNTVLTKVNTVLKKENTVMTKINIVLTKESSAEKCEQEIEYARHFSRKFVWRSGRVVECNPEGCRIDTRCYHF